MTDNHPSIRSVVGSAICAFDTRNNRVLCVKKSILSRDWVLPGGKINGGAFPSADYSFRKKTGCIVPHHLVNFRQENVFISEATTLPPFAVYLIRILPDAMKQFNASMQPNEGEVEWMLPGNLILSSPRFSVFHRQMLTHFGIIKAENLVVNKETETTPLVNILYTGPTANSDFHLRYMVLMEKNLRLQMMRDIPLIDFFKNTFGPQDYTHTREFRYWVWERENWRVYVSNKKGVSFEIHKACDVKQALDAYESFLNTLEKVDSLQSTH